MASARDLRTRILDAFAGVPRALHPRELATRLELDPDEYEELFAELAVLADRGQLTTLPGGRMRLREKRSPSGDGRREPSEEAYDGALTMHPRGFGFVSAAGRDDVFVPPDAIFEALHGDTVKVRIVGRGPRGAEGRIEGVVRRRSPRVAGTVHRRRKSCWLEPDDSRLRGPITITEGEELARDGDAAVVEITRFPSYEKELCEARVLQILGPAGDPRTEVQKILVREQVREEHSPASLTDAETIAARLRRLPLGERRDLRHVPLPTIDPTDARDHDDAVWVERTPQGYRAYVAIADVSEYVPEGTALDEEARLRGCTIYLPDRAIPMLPSQLAADLCSLLPGVERYCLCVIAELDVHGIVRSYEVVEGLMRSAARLTYDGVARTLGFDPESPQSPEAEAMKRELSVLAELSERLRRRRFERGALELDLPEARVHLDTGTGVPTAVTQRATRPGLKRAYSMIEEMMLLANELVAEWLTKKQAPAIYRVHGKPDARKLEKLALVGEKLGVPVDVDSLLEPLGVSRFLRDTADHERAHVLHLLLLRSLKQAQYSIDNEGHFGLASSCYLHFTSPIRRYPDLCVHRQVKKLLRGGAVDRSSQALETLRAAATESSTRERAAMDIEREVVDLYRALYMQQHVGDSFEARVSALTGSGAFVAIREPFCDVLVRFESMGPDRYELSEDELSIVGARSGDTVTLGDTLQVLIEDAALARRTVYGRRVLDERQLEALRTQAREPARGARPFERSGRGSPRAREAAPPARDRAESGARSSRGGSGASGGGRTTQARSDARSGGRTSRDGRGGSGKGSAPTRSGAASGSREVDEARPARPGSRRSRPLLRTGLVKKPGQTHGAKSASAEQRAPRKKPSRRK